MFNFIEQLKVLAEQNPNDRAIEQGSSSMSFAELWENLECVSSNATRLGYQPGDTFIFASKPTPKSISMALGLVHAGLCLAFIDPFTATHSFGVRVKLVAPRLVIAESTLFALGSKKLAGLRRLFDFNIADYGSVVDADFFYSGSWKPFLPKKARAVSNEFFKPVKRTQSNSRVVNSNSIIVFTSGTTAEPKGVVHSLESISANFQETAEIFDLNPGDRVLCEPMTVGLVAVTAGATWIIPTGRATPDFNKYFGVPTDALKLLSKFEENGAPKLDHFGMGGAPIPPSLVRRVIDVLGDEVKIPCIYGMTEILPVAFCDGRQKFHYTDGDLIGKPLAGVEIKFAEDSEILVRGAGLMKEYLGQEPAGWHPTGDLGKVDSEGNLVMLARKKNMLIRGDMNIYPSLYEPGLTNIPGVADAVIVGVPDEFSDDQIALFIVPSKSQQSHRELKALVEKEMPHHIDRDALPDLVIVLDQLPVSGRGQKRDMVRLKEIAAEFFSEHGK